MRDRKKGDRLARAIEQMVQGRTPDDLDDEELQELLQIARIRLDAARQADQAGSATESALLERLIARLNLIQGRATGETAGDPTDNGQPGAGASGNEDPEHIDVKELQDIIDLRRQMAEHAASISEAHRDAVWQRVQSRIRAASSERRGWFRWPFRRRDPEAAEFSDALDRLILGEPIWQAEDSNLKELIDAARARQVAAISTRNRFTDQETRVWARLRPRLMARLMPGGRRGVLRRRAVPWPKLAAAGAAVALVIAAVGPLPATGLANHPATELVRFLSGQSGVSETSAPPEVPPVTQVVEGNLVSALEASDLLGVPVYEPTFMPEGYSLASSRYFPEPLTAVDGGLFVLAYESTGPTGELNTTLIYQERSSLNNIVVARGVAHETQLPSGTDATYVRGTWRPLGSDLAWGEYDTQTVVFDVGGLRTIVHTADRDMAMGDLLAIADGLALQTIAR